MPTPAEVAETAEKIAESCECAYVGIRFEDADRAVGDFCGDSRQNHPVDGVYQDLPEFGSAAYLAFPEAEGTCAYRMDDNDWAQIAFAGWALKGGGWFAAHCYIIGGDNDRTAADADEGEIVIANARVMAKIF